MILHGIDLLMDLIPKSKYIVALTGAGISTGAGIPDFRGPNGLYSRTDVPGEKLFSIEYFKQDPALFYTYIADLFIPFQAAEPTKGHKFLKKLEDLGKLKTVVTQNIDGLHRKAGNSYVIEVHGNFDTFVCTGSFQHPVEPLNDRIAKCIVKKEVAKCAVCGAALKPNVVFFGEPVQGLEKALTEVQKADLLIVLGSSLTVYPVAQLPGYLSEPQKLVIVNAQETPYDDRADAVIREDIDAVVDKLGIL